MEPTGHNGAIAFDDERTVERPEANQADAVLCHSGEQLGVVSAGQGTIRTFPLWEGQNANSPNALNVTVI